MACPRLPTHSLPHSVSPSLHLSLAPSVTHVPPSQPPTSMQYPHREQWLVLACLHTLHVPQYRCVISDRPSRSNRLGEVQRQRGEGKGGGGGEGGEDAGGKGTFKYVNLSTPLKLVMNSSLLLHSCAFRSVSLSPLGDSPRQVRYCMPLRLHAFTHFLDYAFVWDLLRALDVLLRTPFPCLHQEVSSYLLAHCPCESITRSGEICPCSASMISGSARE